MDMRCREQPEKWDDSGRDTKGCSSERHIYFWNLIKKLIHSSGNFYKSGSGEQPFVKRKWNRASLTVEASLALPVFLIAVLVLLKIVDLYRLHGMLTVSLQESARYLSVCAYAVDETGKETYEIPETAACIAYAEAKIPKRNPRKWNGDTGRKPCEKWMAGTESDLLAENGKPPRSGAEPGSCSVCESASVLRKDRRGGG